MTDKEFSKYLLDKYFYKDGTPVNADCITIGYIKDELMEKIK